MEVDPILYSNLLQPSRTRTAVQPIKNIPIEKRKLQRNVIVKKSNQVLNLQGFSSSSLYDADADAGKYYYIHIDPYDTSLKTTSVIDEISPLLINPTEFEQGSFYTFIVAATTHATPQLYATKAINMYEFGTKHHQILYRMALHDVHQIEYRLYSAGEILCVNKDTLLFNFYSLTYKMKKHISNRRMKYEAAYMKYMIQQNAPNYTNIRFQHLPLIMNEVLPLTKAELSRLRRHNIPMFLFDTPDQCKNMRNDILRYKNVNKTDFISNNDLHKIYSLITARI